ncbi:MAG: hypothetical protein LUE20_02540 [Oscillospiraceae bacterium]|nr:hypothetical protein [Oscillospiraceae bacterium]
MNKKLLSLLIALVMTVQLLPLSLFASDEETETYISEETYSLSDVSTADNDELFEGYVEQLFGISSDDGIMLTATYTGEDAFKNDSVNLPIYRAFKSAISSIANGDVTSTTVTVTATYAYSDLGTSNLNDAWTAFQSAFNFQSILNYLVYDNPYEMYWFKKDEQTYCSYGASGDGTNITVTITIPFYVASGYQDSTATYPYYTIDASKVTAAKKAVENAQAIVTKYANSGYTDLQLLTYYKNEICDLVTYENKYSSYSYGDVWQLVYVFDGDEDTNVVCEGYSKAFQYLCDLSGLECITVTGYMGTASSLGGHMWNVVYLDGVNYLVDVTNTDGNGIGKDGDLFMVCADDASKILDGSEATTYTLDGTATTAYHTGYAFLIGSTTVTYVYDSYSLALYPYESYLALGSKYYGRALTLDGEIGVTYYFQLSGVENPGNYYLMASIGGTSSYAQYTAVESKTIDDITYCRYTVYVNPTQVSSDIYAYLTNGSDTVSIDTYDTYSVYDYCEYAITTTGWEDEKTVCEAVLNYAYYATVYAGSSSSLQSTLKSIDSTWTDPISSIDVSGLSSYATTSDGVDKTLVLGSGVYIRVYVDDASATYTVDGEELEVVTSGSTSYVEFKVYAKEMYRTFTILKDGATYTTYSVYRYIYNICTGTVGENGITSELQNLCKAIYDYGEKARAYNNWL